MDFLESLVVDLQSLTEARVTIAQMVDDVREDIVVCLGNAQQAGQNTRIVPVEVIHDDIACTLRTTGRVMPDARFLLWCIKRAAARSCSFILIHTHPGAADPVTLSPVDLEAARSILSVAQKRVPQCRHVFAVIGHTSAFAVTLAGDQLLRVELSI